MSFVLAASAVALVGCDGCGRRPTPAPVTNTRELIDVSSFTFEDPSERDLFMKFRRYAVTKVEGLHHVPMGSGGGNSIRETWCTPQFAKGDCDNARLDEKTPQGTRWFGVSVLHYTNQLPKVFSTGYSAGEVPRQGTLGGSVSVGIGGRGVYGSGFTVTLADLDRRKAPPLKVRTDYREKIRFTDFVVHAPGLPTEDRDLEAKATIAELRRLLESPKSFRDTVLARYKSLSDDVEGAFAANKVEKRKCGEYEGRGIPPPCWGVPLSPAEEQSELARFQKAHSAKEAKIKANYREYHTFLVRLLPPGLLGSKAEAPAQTADGGQRADADHGVDAE